MIHADLHNNQPAINLIIKMLLPEMYKHINNKTYPLQKNTSVDWQYIEIHCNQIASVKGSSNKRNSN